jgi:hypothetical protein
MASQVQLANYALGLVAEHRILALTDLSEPARLCTLHLDQTVREVLRAGLFRCARKRAVITPDAVAPAFEWTYAYSLPSDWLRVVKFNETEPQDVVDYLFEIEGKKLLTDESTCNLVYIYDVTTQLGGAGYNQLDELCTRAVYTLLASKLAVPLRGGGASELKNVLLGEAERLISKASAINARDAFEPLKSVAANSDWLTARQ